MLKFVPRFQLLSPLGQGDSNLIIFTTLSGIVGGLGEYSSAPCCKQKEERYERAFASKEERMNARRQAGAGPRLAHLRMLLVVALVAVPQHVMPCRERKRRWITCECIKGLKVRGAVGDGGGGGGGGGGGAAQRRHR